MASIAGGCLCERLRYTVSAEPSNPHYCSCRQCQRWSGAPVVAWIDAPLGATRIDGAPAWHRSSERAQRGFCPSCGSAIFYRSDDAQSIGITTASLDEPDRFRPVKWSYPASAAIWLPHMLDSAK